jgi:hypothetical protein
MLNWKRMTKRIPSKVQLTKQASYEIVWVDSFNNEDILGETRFGKSQIAIKKGMSPKLTVTTYLHEVLHGISAEHGIDLTEKQVLAFESAFYYLLKNNNVFKDE